MDIHQLMNVALLCCLCCLARTLTTMDYDHRSFQALSPSHIYVVEGCMWVECVGRLLDDYRKWATDSDYRRRRMLQPKAGVHV